MHRIKRLWYDIKYFSMFFQRRILRQFCSRDVWYVRSLIKLPENICLTCLHIFRHFDIFRICALKMNFWRNINHTTRSLVTSKPSHIIWTSNQRNQRVRTSIWGQRSQHQSSVWSPSQWPFDLSFLGASQSSLKRLHLLPHLASQELSG